MPSSTHISLVLQLWQEFRQDLLWHVGQQLQRWHHCLLPLTAHGQYRSDSPERANIAIELKIAVRSIGMALPPALAGDLEGF